MIRRIVTILIASAVLVIGTTWIADAIPGISDCKQAPIPDVPDGGIAGFFGTAPDTLPPPADPFAEHSTTSIYEQYGYGGLHWSTYDLGCGPDAMRNPDAVIGTAFANWIMQPALAMTALTGSVTKVAFNPTFLGVFDPTIEKVSGALHDSIFATWIPAVLAALGILLLFRANRASLASSAAAVGWALIVIIAATALFRWPIQAGHAADVTVTRTLGAAVSKLDGDGTAADPGTAVSSNVVDSILYRTWLAGTLGSADSETARRYGPELFKAQALTWREAKLVQDDPDRGRQLIEAKQETWKDIASKIQDEDPSAYEYLTGHRSETRVGYAILGFLAVFLALPFLLISALLLLGCFMIVRLAVMLFPAFATLGAFPNARGIVTGLARTVAAAVVNSIIFGIGAGVTISVLGILMQPPGNAPAWLGLVLMPLFSFVMWAALRPFRRLTSMVSPNDHFRNAAGSFGDAGSSAGGLLKRIGVTAIGSATGNVAAAVATQQMADDNGAATDRVEARPVPSTPPSDGPRALPPANVAAPDSNGADPRGPYGPGNPLNGTRSAYDSGRSEASARSHYVPSAAGVEAPAMPIEPEWDGEDEVYAIYRPADSSEDEDVA